MTDNPQHSCRVSGNPPIGITDYPDNAPVKIFHPAGIVNNGKGRDFIKQTVDGQVPPEGVVRRGAVGIVGRQYFNLAILLFGVVFYIKFTAAPEGRDLNDLVRKKTCTSRKRRPIRRLFLNSLRSCPGLASVLISKSFGVLPK
jgi:hypothetical protein